MSRPSTMRVPPSKSHKQRYQIIVSALSRACCSHAPVPLPEPGKQISFAELREVVYQAAYRPRRRVAAQRLEEGILSEQDLYRIFMRCRSVGGIQGEPLADVSQLASAPQIQRAVYAAVRIVIANSAKQKRAQRCYCCDRKFAQCLAGMIATAGAD